MKNRPGKRGGFCVEDRLNPDIPDMDYSAGRKISDEHREPIDLCIPDGRRMLGAGMAPKP